MTELLEVRPKADDPRAQYFAVSHVYDAYWSARLNVLYYGKRLAQYQFWNKVTDILIAVGTSGTFASLALWKTEWGKSVPAWAAFITAVLRASNKTPSEEATSRSSRSAA